jgi:hypothetical protein
MSSPKPQPPPPKKQAQSPRGEEPGLIPNHKVMPEVYFGDQTFWLRNDDGRFIAANTEVVRRRLKRRGFSGENTKSLNSEIDNILDDTRNSTWWTTWDRSPAMTWERTSPRHRVLVQRVRRS